MTTQDTSDNHAGCCRTGLTDPTRHLLARRNPYGAEVGGRRAASWTEVLGRPPLEASSLLRFWPAAISSASAFTLSSPRSRNLLIPCQSFASANIGSTHTLRFLMAFS